MAPSPTDLLRLGRVHTAAATAAVMGIACHINGGGPLSVLLVSSGALFHHAWGFSLNEVMDLEMDRKAEDLSDKPLVSGRVRKGEAWAFSSLCLLISIGLFSGASLISGSSLGRSLGFLALSTLSGASYDIYGKRHMTFSDALVALWMFFLVLASAACAAGQMISLTVWTVAILSAVHILFNNSVEGGIKDVENDRRYGVPTLAVVTGCRIERGRLVITKGFFIWGVLLRAVFAVLAACASLFIAERAGWGDWFIIAVALAGTLLFGQSLAIMNGNMRWDRERLLRGFAVHEMASYALLLFVVLPDAGPIPVFAAFLAPMLWFFLMNRAIYRTTLSPKV